MTSGEPRRLRERLGGLPAAVARVPWWVSTASGLALVTVGLALLIRPLTALTLLGIYIGFSALLAGIGDVLTQSREARLLNEPTGPVGYLVAVAWIIGGIAALTVTAVNPAYLGTGVAVFLIATGTVNILRFLQHRSMIRCIGALIGAAEIAFGAVALLWPDATLVIVGLLFAGRMIAFGVGLLWRTSSLRIHHSRSSARRHAAAPRSGTATVGLRWVSTLTILAVSIGTVWVSHSLRQGGATVDEFYAAPADLDGRSPGELLRSQPYDGNLPTGLIGHRLLYVTTDAAGTPTAASAVLAVPARSEGAIPLITWAHGTVGIAQQCAPSLGPDAISAPGIPATDRLADNGWAMVATDYPGMGTVGNFPYLIGEGQGRATLDAARAARHLDGIDWAPETVVWGHSQGGHAALWAGQLADSYAPELDVRGTAALSPAVDPYRLADAVIGNRAAPGATLAISFVTESYADYYPNVHRDDILTPTGRAMAHEAAQRCVTQTATLVTVLTGFAVAHDTRFMVRNALSGPFAERLRQNIADGPWTAPLFIAQGDADEVLPFGLTVDYVEQLCRARQPLEFSAYPGASHMGVLEPGQVPDQLTRWTQERFAGAAPQTTCA